MTFSQWAGIVIFATEMVVSAVALRIGYLLADVGEVSHTTIIGIATSIVVTLGGVIAFLGKYLIDLFNKELLFVRSEKDKIWGECEMWRSETETQRIMCRELATLVADFINKKRALDGLQPFTPVEPIVPMHHSPISDVSQRSADNQTMRKRIIAARKELGLPVQE